jgi:hypothetical protein
MGGIQTETRIQTRAECRDTTEVCEIKNLLTWILHMDESINFLRASKLKTVSKQYRGHEGLGGGAK